jgi:hypothetical protein
MSSTSTRRKQTVTLRGPKRTVELKIPIRRNSSGWRRATRSRRPYTQAVAVVVEPAKK